ncbi:MAG: GcrA family cell cycle regulator [Roseococcus sp.]|nr:GcrA family cell cycle regulator [Roseococcus sp.]
MEWTSEAIDRLRALWAEGHSTAEIGRRMGISKNAVVGKAHRLQLPARPSPIRRDPAAPRPVAAGRRPTLPPLRVVASTLPSRREDPAPTVVPTAAAPVTPPAAKAAGVVRAFPRMGARSCCWPIGEPGTPGFKFCTAEALPGKPYCPEHAAVAYVRVKDRREDAA